MPLKFNPLLLNGFDYAPPASMASPLYKSPVDTEGDLPTPATDGEARVVRATDHIYIYDGDAGEWVDIGLVPADFGSAPNDAGYTIDNPIESGIRRNAIVLQPADATHPGSVSITDQDIAGSKTFLDEVVLDYTTASLPIKTNASKELVAEAIDLSSAETTGQLDAVRVGNGDVSNTELSYISTVTSNVQDQLDSKLVRSNGDIDETLFNGSNNVSVAADITGFSFASSVRSFDAIVDVEIVATASSYEFIRLTGVNKNGTWTLYKQSFGDISGVEFFISAGQVQYTSPNSAGFTSLQIKFRALTLND